jgi:hypothetical protein
MAEIVNLRRARKARERAERVQVAKTNRALSGETKAEREARQVARARAGRVLDGAKLENE